MIAQLILKEGDYAVFNECTLVLIKSSNPNNTYSIIDEEGYEGNRRDSLLKPITTQQALLSFNKLILPNLSEDYNAVIDFNNNVLKVGCQEVSFEMITKIAALINTNAEELRK